MQLGLSDEADSPVVAAPWIGALIALGVRARRYAACLSGRQMVVAISVPRRDYAGALIGSGWMLAAPPPELDPPNDVFRAARSGTPLRAVTENLVVAGNFSRLDENREQPRVLVAGKLLPVERYKAVAVLDAEVEAVASSLPEPGFLGRMAGVTDTWLERMACPSADLALVGTARWLEEDLAACIGNADESLERPCPLSNYVLPEEKKAATWATRVYPSSRLAEELPLPTRYEAVVLDGTGAIKYLDDITAPIVVCVVDRSVADETAAETIMQARSANSRPISLQEDLGWSPPTGIEALAFTVAR